MPATHTPSNTPPNRTLLYGTRAVLVVYWVTLGSLTHWPSLGLGPSPMLKPTNPYILLQQDKPIHMLAFGLLAALIILARPLGARAGLTANHLTGAGIALAYAVLDETTQGLTADRTVSISDLLANAMGVVGILVIALTPSGERVQPPRRTTLRHLMVLPTGVGVLAAGGFLLAINRTVNNETVILHFVAAIAVALTLLRRPALQRWPRFSALLACAAVAGVVAFGELAQAFSGLPFSRAEVFYGELGLLLTMGLWSARLAVQGRQREADDLRNHASDSHTSKSDAAEQAEPAPASSRFVGHAVLVSAFTLLSRLTGLARDAVLAAAFGLSTVADAFFIGFLVPNLFRRLFGEGALTAAFIPHYTELREQDPQLAKRFASLVLTLLTVLLLAVTGVAELGLWWLASSIDDGADAKAALAVYYTRLMLPYMPMICLVALAGGVLQVHKKFGPPAAAPLILNAVIIAATVFATGGFKDDSIDAEYVGTLVALGVLAAGVLQLAWQLLVLRSTAGFTRHFDGVGPRVRAMLVMMGPMVLGLAVFQINALLDSLIAFFFAPPQGAAAGSTVSLLGWSFAAPLQNGDVAALQWSQRLYQFPLGVFGIAIATAIFPALSAAAAAAKGWRADALGGAGGVGAKPQAAGEEFAAILRQGLRLTVFIGLPASVGLLLVRVPLARVVYERGAFDTGDALRVATILTGYATSVWAYSMMHTVTRGFYALKDATTPLKVSVGMVSLNLTLNLTLIWPLGAAGLAWSTAASAMAQVVLLLLLIRRRVDRPIDGAVLRSWGRTAAASAVMAGVLLPALFVWDPAALSRGGAAGLLIGMTAIGAGVVLGVAKLSGAEELAWVGRRRKLTRGE